MDIHVGQQYRTRAGATVEVTRVIDTGLMRYDYKWKPLGHASLVLCRIAVCADGTRLVDRQCEYAVHDDGHYYSDRDSPLDIVAAVQRAAA